MLRLASLLEDIVWVQVEVGRLGLRTGMHPLQLQLRSPTDEDGCFFESAHPSEVVRARLDRRSLLVGATAITPDR